MFTLERPNMAVNDPRVSAGTDVRRFRMWNTWDIRATETRIHIVQWVARVARSARGGKLKNLVLNCHGNSGSLQLGQGFDGSNTGLFSQWLGLVEKVWLPDCLVAQGVAGDAFCAEMARQAGCYLVAPTEVQCDYFQDVPHDQMTSFEGLVLCYDPTGSIVWQGRNPSTWSRGNSWTDRLLGRAGACVPVPD
jgi:hypothetical protein